MGEQMESKKSTWADAVGPVYIYKDVCDIETVNPDHLIVLETADGTKVCPVKQFVENEDGATATSPYVYFGWRLRLLSGLDSWSDAAGFFMPLKGKTESYSDLLTNPSLSHDQKIDVCRSILMSEVADSTHPRNITTLSFIYLNTIILLVCLTQYLCKTFSWR